MARTKRSAKIETRSARLKTSVETGKMHQEPLAPGLYLAYRKPDKGGSGSWFARWNNEGKISQTRLGIADDFQDADGQTILTYAQAQAAAGEWFKLREHQALHGDDSQPQSGPLTVWDAVTRYLKKIEDDGAKSVYDARLRAELWIKPTLGDIEVAKLTKPKVEAWRKSITESAPKRNAKNPKNAEDTEAKPLDEEAKRKRKSTSNRTLTILKAALNTARTERWVVCPPDAWELVKPYRDVEEARQEYLQPKDQTRLLNAIQEPDFKRLVAGAMATGARYGDLCRMKVGDFDPSGTGSVFFPNPKQKKSYRVLLTEEGRAFFLELVAGRKKDELMFIRDNPERRKNTGQEGAQGWMKNDQTRRMKEACKAAELPNIGFHQLRHSYASALVAAGMPLALVAKFTGHSDTRMLEKHYAHLAPSDLSRALKAFAPTLGLPGGKIKELEIKRA